jgi:hypothetical protein
MRVSAKVLRVPCSMLSDFCDFLNSQTPRNQLIEFVILSICSETESNFHRFTEWKRVEKGKLAFTFCCQIVFPAVVDKESGLFNLFIYLKIISPDGRGLSGDPSIDAKITLRM